MKSPKCQPYLLKSSLGQPAEGKERYFSRPQITQKICRAISHGENILISAPRRIGKSSLLKDIQTNFCPGIHSNTDQQPIIKYMIIQSVDSGGLFFKKLYMELIQDTTIFEGANGYFKNASHAVRSAFSKIRGISLEGIKLDAENSINYYQECFELITHLKDKKIILIIDEFPDAVNNINKKDRDLAIQFLQQHRDLRQQSSQINVQFIYTGSTGLRNVVTKIGKLDLINDIKEIALPPLSHNEAKCFIQCLELGYQLEDKGFELSPQQIDYILEKITWYLPYYLQAIVYTLFEHFEDGKLTTILAIDEVLLSMTKAKSPYSPYFENWLHRLKKAFDKEEYELAIKILNHIAQRHSIDKPTLKELSKPYTKGIYKFIMQTLEYDGYINEHYQFNSVLLKKWWLENVVD